MIKLFRNIRKNLLNEGKTTKYFKYAIGEIVLVVIGILIALNINNWNEAKKQNHSRKEYYQQLLVDLNKDIESANGFIENSNTDRKEYNNYVELYNNKNLKSEEVYNALMKLNLLSTAIKFHSSTIESLRSSGELILFPLEIRNKLLDLIVTQSKILEASITSDGQKANVIRSMAMVRGGSTLELRLGNNPQLKSYLKIEDNLPQIILGLDATHRWKEHSEIQSIRYLEIMIEDIEVIIDLIKSEMHIL